MKDFEFYAGGIEDAILQLLEGEMKPLGVKTFATYSGELDSENIKRALGELTPKFPLILVAYGDGEDKRLPSVSPVLGEPIHFRHDCTFIVTCVTNDARGDKNRRRGKVGCYRMISRVRDILSGLQIKKVISDADLEMYGDAVYLGEEVLLTYEPLMPLANEYIARLPDIAAYAVPFETYFKWSSKIRSQTGANVVSVTTNVQSLNENQNSPANMPGVTFIQGEN